VSYEQAPLGESDSRRGLKEMRRGMPIRRTEISLNNIGRCRRMMAALTAFLQDRFDVLVERYRRRSLESKYACKGNQSCSFRDVHHPKYSRPPNKPKGGSDRAEELSSIPSRLIDLEIMHLTFLAAGRDRHAYASACVGSLWRGASVLHWH